MVVACRGDGSRLAASMARRLISLTEAAGTPEGGKVLGRGSAPMGAVLGIGPYDAEQAAGVKFAQVYRCFVPVQGDATHKESFLPHLAAVTRGGDANRHGGAECLGSILEIYITKRPCKKVPVGNCPAHVPGAHW